MNHHNLAPGLYPVELEPRGGFGGRCIASRKARWDSGKVDTGPWEGKPHIPPGGDKPSLFLPLFG